LSYQIELAPAARRQIKKLPRSGQIAVAARIEALTEHPRPPGCKKLSGEENLYRVRTGDYRIVYQVQDAQLIVLVVRVGDRKDVYRGDLG
jgi:mRNA interferase RelE/StbE